MSLRLNSDVVSWAITRSGLSMEDLVRSFPKLPQWLDGTWEPTVKQLCAFAERLHVKLFELFGETRPDYALQIADFRTVDDGETKDPSPELYDTVDMMLARQNWMREYFTHEGYEAVAFVGSYRNRSMDDRTAAQLAADLHEALGLDEGWAARCRTVEDALRTFKDAVERLGVSVAVNGTVGDNTRRTLEVTEFRGFVLADPLAPVIFINGRDAKSAQVFTLAHELAHLAFAQTGVSNPGEDGGAPVEVERFCNAVAAEFLVPSGQLENDWGSAQQADSYANIKRIATLRKVSFMVVCRRAHDMGLIADAEFFSCQKRHKSEAPAAKRQGGGGDFYNNKRYKLGNVFSEAVFGAVNSDYLTYRDAYDLTGLSAPSFKRYFEEVA